MLDFDNQSLLSKLDAAACSYRLRQFDHRLN